MSNGTSISFGDNAKVDTLATGEHAIVDKSQGKTVVHGDLHGGVHTKIDTAPVLDPVQFIAALQNVYHVESAKIDAATPVVAASDMTDDQSLERSLDQVTLGPDTPPLLAAPPVCQTTASADAVFTDLKETVADPAPAPSKVASSLTAFKALVLEKGPVFGLALCNAAKAWAKTQILTHPIAAAVYAFLETFTGKTEEAPQ